MQLLIRLRCVYDWLLLRLGPSSCRHLRMFHRAALSNCIFSRTRPAPRTSEWTFSSLTVFSLTFHFHCFCCSFGFLNELLQETKPCEEQSFGKMLDRILSEHSFQRNIRERERVAEMSAAFNKLKEKLSFQSWEKPTKKRILRNAIRWVEKVNAFSSNSLFSATSNFLRQFSKCERLLEMVFPSAFLSATCKRLIIITFYCCWLFFEFFWIAFLVFFTQQTHILSKIKISSVDVQQKIFLCVFYVQYFEWWLTSCDVLMFSFNSNLLMLVIAGSVGNSLGKILFSRVTRMFTASLMK